VLTFKDITINDDVYILTVLFCRVNGQLKERSDSTSSYGMPNDVFESVDAHGKYKVSNFKNVLIFIFCKGYPHRIIT